MYQKEVATNEGATGPGLSTYMYLQYRSHRDQRHPQFNKFHTMHRCSIFSLIELLWKLLICKNGAQEKKTLSLMTGKRIATKFCMQRCLKRTWLTSEGIFVRFLGVLRGEHAHCKNNGHGFFNREKILHCKPVNAPFTLVHVRELLHLRRSLDSNTALGFASCMYSPLNCASRAIIHVHLYSTRNSALTNT